MILTYFFTIALIIINSILIIILINKLSKERFTIYKLASDSIINLNKIKLGGGGSTQEPKIYVGGKSDIPIHSNIHIGPNNNIFIKEDDK